LGVDRETVRRWRHEYPEIDAMILEESIDFLAASKHRMAALMPLADQAVEDALTSTKVVVVGEGADCVPDTLARLAAAKMVRQPFEKAQPASKVAVTVTSHERALPSTGSARVVDAEPDDFSDLIGPDRHAAR
jgi:hypothetical protein